MHPAFIAWWKSHQHSEGGNGCGAEAGCGSHGGGHGHHGHGGWREKVRAHFEAAHEDSGGGGAFGVRRPLRFLAWKLDLDEKQVGELAKILDELKTERAQAEVDGRRTTTALAEAVGGAAFDEAKAGEGGALRVKSAERLRDAVVRALKAIHAQLTDEQRTRLAYLIRTGVVTI